MAKVLGINIPDEFLTLWQKALHFLSDSTQTNVAANQAVKNKKNWIKQILNSYLPIFQPVYDGLPQYYRDAWTLYWTNLPFGPHSGAGGWPGSGFSAFVFLNAPRQKAGLPLILYPFTGTVAAGRTTVAAFREFFTIIYAAKLGLYVAADFNFSSVIWTSVDGIHWTNSFSPSSSTILSAIAYSPSLNLFVWSGSFSGVGFKYFTSPNGTSWTQRSGLNLGSQAGAWSEKNQLFVMTGVALTTSKVFTSPDGFSWTERWTMPVKQVAGSCLNDNEPRFVVARADGAGSDIYTSVDFIIWHRAFNSATDFISDVFYSSYLNKYFALLGVAGTDNLLTSIDGVNWSKESTGLNFIPQKGAYSNDQKCIFIVGTISGQSRLLYSLDGSEWFVLGLSPNFTALSACAADGNGKTVFGTIGDIWYITGAIQP